MPIPDHYATLGVARTATDLSIKKAYRRLVLRYHPDRNPGNRAAEDQFKKVVLAYETLSRNRADYDQQLSSVQQSQAERMAEAMRRQEARRRSAARASSAWRSQRASAEYRSNEFDRRDILNGTIWGGVLATLVGTALAPEAATLSWIGLLLWSLLPLAGGICGVRCGAWLERKLEPVAAQLTVGAPLAYRLLPVLSPAAVVVLVGLMVVLARHWGHAALTSDALLGSSIAGGLGAALGSGFGRAFTSVAVRPLAKLAGIAIGTLVGALSGGILGIFLAMNQVSRWLDKGDYDGLVTTMLAGALGAAVASAYGSRQRP